MDRKKVLGFTVVFLFSIFIVACSDKTDEEEAREKDPNREVQEASSDTNVDEADREDHIAVNEKEVEIEGEYADILTSLEIPFKNDTWKLSNYEESEGEAIAEFSKEDDTNDSKQLTLHYFTDEKTSAAIDPFIRRLEEKLLETVTGDFEFNTLEVSAEEGLYAFSVMEDNKQPDQEEIGRAFVKDGDLFVIRYTAMEQTMDDKDDWIENLRAVQ